ncbi:hypothetical protein GGI35DRAFT_181697 [Trichoderma velutinum]
MDTVVGIQEKSPQSLPSRREIRFLSGVAEVQKSAFSRITSTYPFTFCFCLLLLNMPVPVTKFQHWPKPLLRQFPQPEPSNLRPPRLYSFFPFLPFLVLPSLILHTIRNILLSIKRTCEPLVFEQSQNDEYPTERSTLKQEAYIYARIGQRHFKNCVDWILFYHLIEIYRSISSPS